MTEKISDFGFRISDLLAAISRGVYPLMTGSAGFPAHTRLNHQGTNGW